jgi:hypothetical protein
VHQSDPIGAESQDTETDTNITVDATGVAGGIVIDSLMKSVAAEAGAEGADQTEVDTDGTVDGASTNLRVQSSYESGAGTKTMSWSYASNASAALRAVPVNPAASSTRRPIAPIFFQ